MTGRLGNQLFQYATVKAFKERYQLKDEINLDFKKVRKEGNEQNGYGDNLQFFKLSNYLCDIKCKKSIVQIFCLICYYMGILLIKLSTSKEKIEKKRYKFEKKIQPILNYNGIYAFFYGYYDFKPSKTKNKIFLGFFESARYFDVIKNELQQEFEPQYPKREKNKELYEFINKNESVCVTIRRGDFLDDKFRDKHYICTPEYFYQAIEIMNEKFTDPKFVIFSDDIEWVKKNMTFPKGTHFESGDDPVWEKLRLMYQCKHFIISNSTFSWWAQYLSPNKNKVVIAPKKWNNIGDNPDIYEDTWIKI